LNAGHEIRDDNGVLVAVVARDVYRGETIMADNFIYSDGVVRVDGEIIPAPILRAAGYPV
jgi:hypothetical protein